MDLQCFPVSNEADLQECLALRHAVFVQEQGVPENLEIDGQDATARHFAARTSEKIIATCRVRLMGSAAKIERVAVAKPFRGKGIGAILMKYIMAELKKTADIALFKLSAQADAVPFYEGLGFRAHGQEYMDAGIPHYDMVREKNPG